jgi:hypothetical protein
MTDPAVTVSAFMPCPYLTVPEIITVSYAAAVLEIDGRDGKTSATKRIPMTLRLSRKSQRSPTSMLDSSQGLDIATA